MARGENDLNLLLKAKVVEIKVKLDYKNSNLPSQVREISKYLENNPVKLKVKLDASVGEINKEIAKIQTILRNAKSFKPIKLRVDIDVAGSAKNIKEQLKGIDTVVKNFNDRYGKEVKKMAEYTKKANQEALKAQTNIPTRGVNVQNPNYIKRYKEALTDAEKILRSKFPKDSMASLFSTKEMKDAEGNLRGFVATLSRANGVVEKLNYGFNSDKNIFEVLNRETVTSTEKSVHKATQELGKLERQIRETGNLTEEFQKRYDGLIQKSKDMTLTSDDVYDFKKDLDDFSKVEKEKQKEIKETERLLKEQQREREKQAKEAIRLAKEEQREQIRKNDLHREEAQLLKQIKRQIDATQDRGLRKQGYQLIDDVRSTRGDAEAFKDRKAQYADYTALLQKRTKQEREALQVEQQKARIEKELAGITRNYSDATRRLSKEALLRTQSTLNEAKSLEELRKVHKRMGNHRMAVDEFEHTEKYNKSIEKLRTTMMSYAQASGKSIDALMGAHTRLVDKADGDIARIQRHIRTYDKMITNAVNDSRIKDIQEQQKTVMKGFDTNTFRNAIKDGDIDKAKELLKAYHGIDIATARIREHKGNMRFVATLDSTGKTAKQVTYELDALNNTMRRVSVEDRFNQNANKGVFEQLRIAMARVPVWMTAMTAFYGSIRSVQAMTREILEVDKALTELRRVADSGINIDTVFRSGIDLSKELGNNIHDVMQTMNDMARTFGHFNERQLTAITRTATLASNVSDLTANEAANSLVGTMNAFNIEAEESIRIVDAMNEVDNNFAISTKQLSEGLQKSASTASTFGVEMEESIGHITAIGAVTMESGRVIGNGLKTIYSRITTMQGVEDIFNEIGMSVKDVEGNVRPVNDILNELAGRWFDLTDSQRQNIGVTVAGRYQLSRFLALMNNYEMALEATATAVTSEGSAMRENAEYMKSFEARINQLKNSFTEFSLAVGDAVLSDSILLIVEALKELAQLGSSLSGTIGFLPIIGLAIGAIADRMKVFEKSKGAFKNAMQDMYLEFRIGSEEARKHAQAHSKNATIVNSSLGGMKGAMTSLKATGTMAFTALGTAVRGFGVAVKSVLASLGIGVIFALIGVAIEKLVGHFAEAKLEAEEVEKQNQRLVESFRSIGESGVQELIANYERLSAKAERLGGATKLSADEQREFSEVIAVLAEKFPTMVDYIDAKGEAHLKSADAMKKELEVAKELSRLEAIQETNSFKNKASQRAKDYEKAYEELEKVRKKMAELESNEGQVVIDHKAGRAGGKTVSDYRDTTQERIALQIEEMKIQSQLTEYVQETNRAIGAQALAYFEATGKAGALGESQKVLIEDFALANEGLIRATIGTDKATEAQVHLAGQSQQLGNIFVEAFDVMTQGLEDSPTAINAVRKELGTLADAIPRDFLQVFDDNGNATRSTEELSNALKEVVNVSAHVEAGSDAYDTLKRRLMEAGMSSQQATQLLRNLANEHSNSAIRAGIQEDAVDGVTDSLNEMNQASYEAVNAIKNIFGFDSTDLGNLESALLYLDSMKEIHGDSALEMDGVKEQLYNITELLGIQEEQLWGNLDGYRKIGQELQLFFQEYANPENIGKPFEEIMANVEGLSKEAKEHIRAFFENDGTTNVLSGEVTNVNEELHKVQDASSVAKGAVQEVFATPGNGFNPLKGTAEDTRVSIEDLQRTGATPTPTNFLNPILANSPYAKLAILGLNEDLNLFKQNTATDGGANFGGSAKTEAQTTKTEIDKAKQAHEQFAQKLGIPINPSFPNITQPSGQFQTDAENAGNSYETLSGKLSTPLKINNVYATQLQDLGLGLDNTGSKADNMSTKSQNAGANAESAGAKGSQAMEQAKSSAEKTSTAVENSSRKIKSADDSSKKSSKEVANTMRATASSVISSSNAMVSAHSRQASSLQRLASSARNARSALQGINSSSSSAIASLGRVAGMAMSIPARLLASSVNTEESGNSNAVSMTSTDSSFTASNGEATGGSSADGGTSGIMQSSISSGFDLNGELQLFGDLASTKSSAKEELPELHTFNRFERQADAIKNTIDILNAKMKEVNKSTKEYRDMIKKILPYENQRLSVLKQDLKATQDRQRAIERSLNKFSNTKKHSKSVREFYNEISQEYEQNIKKIQSLSLEIEQSTIEIMGRAEEIYNDFLDEILEGFDNAVEAIRDRSSDLDFKMEILNITDPDNQAKKIELLNLQAMEYRNEHERLVESYARLENQLVSVSKAYGPNSEGAQKLIEKLKDLKSESQDAYLSMLKAQKEIANTRKDIADDMIDSIKDMYDEQEKIATKAIDRRIDAFKKEHKAVMDMYDERIKKVKELYDARIDAIDDEANAEDHRKEVAERTEEITELRNRITLLSRNDSPEGRKMLSETQKELEEAQESLNEYLKEHHRNALKEQLENERDAQIEAIEQKRDAEDKMADAKLEALEKEKDAISEHYKQISDEEMRWAKIRDDLIKGNFESVKAELSSMGIHLDQLADGTFDTLSDGFAQYSQEVRNFVLEINSMIREITTAQQGFSPTANTEPMRARSLPELIRKSYSGEQLLEPSAQKNYIYDLIRNSGQPEGRMYEILKKAESGEPLMAPTPEKMMFYNLFREILGKKPLVAFDTGGYTGDQEGIAMLHKKELILNKEDTSNILDVVKLVRDLPSMIPNVMNGLLKSSLKSVLPKIGNGEGGTVDNSVNVHIESLVGTKENANMVVREIKKAMKKSGKG